jgi:hypothetical protein
MVNKIILLLLKLIIFLIPFSFYNAEFNPDFRAFVHNRYELKKPLSPTQPHKIKTKKRYGLPIVNQLERRDLGNDASTGGGLVVNEEAVIIVHGITNKITRFNVKKIKIKKKYFRE